MSPPCGSACHTASHVRGASFSSSSATHDTPRRSSVIFICLGMPDLPPHVRGWARRLTLGTCLPAPWDPSWPLSVRVATVLEHAQRPERPPIVDNHTKYA